MTDRPASPAAARVARPIIAASGSLSTPTRFAAGQRRPAAARNLAEPVPGSTTRAGLRVRAAQPTMAATTGAGVKVWPADRRRVAARTRQNASPSGSAPARIWPGMPPLSASPASPARGMVPAASARRCSASDQPATCSAPIWTASLASASSAAEAAAARPAWAAAAGPASVITKPLWRPCPWTASSLGRPRAGDYRRATAAGSWRFRQQQNVPNQLSGSFQVPWVEGKRLGRHRSWGQLGRSGWGLRTSIG